MCQNFIILKLSNIELCTQLIGFLLRSPLYKFQLSFRHFFKFSGLRETLPPGNYVGRVPVWMFSVTAHLSDFINVLICKFLTFEAVNSTGYHNDLISFWLLKIRGLIEEEGISKRNSAYFPLNTFIMNIIQYFHK